MGTVIVILFIILAIIYAIIDEKAKLRNLSIAKEEVDSIRTQILNCTINNRSEALDVMESILFCIHKRFNQEAGIIVYLSVDNVVIGTDFILGDSNSVTMPPKEIVDKCKQMGAHKIIVGHNHPGDNPTPSDKDIRHGAVLELLARESSINLIDDFVICSGQLKSIKNAKRFKDMVKDF